MATACVNHTSPTGFARPVARSQGLGTSPRSLRSHAASRRPSRLAGALQQRASALAAELPSFIPPAFAEEIEEPAAHDMMRRYSMETVDVPSLGPVRTAYVGPAAPSADRPAVVLLHGFDSSSLEFRRFHPLLSQVADVYAVDLAGWGFTDAGFADNAGLPLGACSGRRVCCGRWRRAAAAAAV